MNIDEIRKAVSRVIKKHRHAFHVIGSSQTKLLELGAVTGIAEHYRSQGCDTSVLNPKGKHTFIVKTSSRGFPWNFSRIHIAKGRAICELHMNLMVKSAHDEGVYCVDVGIARPGSIPIAKPKKTWNGVDNAKLISFAEVKKLVIYPMLLAQFVGIVHEIKPAFLKKGHRTAKIHPSPSLIVLGHYSGNSQTIVSHYKKRNIDIMVAENYDGRLSRIRTGAARSPFEPSESGGLSSSAIGCTRSARAGARS